MTGFLPGAARSGFTELIRCAVGHEELLVAHDGRTACPIAAKPMSIPKKGRARPASLRFGFSAMA
jgi:hypothetical protein